LATLHAAGKGKDYELEISDVLMPGDLEGKKQLSFIIKNIIRNYIQYL
jgi:hypothetical protein